MQNVYNLSEDDLLREQLDKLRKNEANISREDLKTKYKKSYHALLADINRLANVIMQQELFNFLYPEDFLERGRSLFLEQYEQNKFALATALFKNYSFDEYVEILRNMNSVILKEFFSTKHIFNGKIGQSINPWIVQTSAATA